MDAAPVLAKLRFAAAAFVAAGLSTEQPRGAAFTLLFCRDRADVAARLPRAIELAAPDSLLWIAYPKLTSPLASDIHRDSLRALVEARGMRTVTQVAIDEDWSALRLRPAERG